MKCPHCGAEATGDVCEYCGSRLKNENKDNSYNGGCPQCGSKNMDFYWKRRSKNLKEHMAVCNECGFTWVIGNNALFEVPPSALFWVFGFLLCFPVPVTLLLWRAKSLPQMLKYVLIAVVWLIYFGLFVFPWVMPWITFWL